MKARGIQDEIRVRVPWSLGKRFRVCLLHEGKRIRPVIEELVRGWTEATEAKHGIVYEANGANEAH